REEFARLAGFESLLVQYAQTITAYVDTKDRSVEALPLALHAAFEAVADEMEMRAESSAARERRMRGAVDEVRSSLGVAHHAIQTLKREIERLGSSPAAGRAESTRATAPAER